VRFLYPRNGILHCHHGEDFKSYIGFRKLDWNNVLVVGQSVADKFMNAEAGDMVVILYNR
jgi:hypothetical protein